MLPEKVRSACTVSDRYDNAPCPPATRTPTRTPRCNTETRPHTITVAVNAALNPLRRVTDRTSCAHKRPSHTTSRASTSPRDPRTTPQRGFQVCFSIKVCFGFLFFRRVLDQVHLGLDDCKFIRCVQRNVSSTSTAAAGEVVLVNKCWHWSAVSQLLVPKSQPTLLGHACSIEMGRWPEPPEYAYLIMVHVARREVDRNVAAARRRWLRLKARLDHNVRGCCRG